MSVGENVRRLRFEKDCTNKEIAEYCGTTTAAISAVIRKNKMLSFDKMRRLADFFGVTLDDLVK